MSHLPIPGPETVDLHVVDLERSSTRLERLLACLSDDEVVRADRLLDRADGRRFARARAFLRFTLSRYTGQEPGKLAFGFGAQGKPSLKERGEGCCGHGIFFNLSHSRSICALAVASSFDVGVDVEFVRDFRAGLAERFFSEREVAALDRLKDPDRVDAFFRCWTRKEAVVKALGDGLTRSLKSFDVSIDVSAPALMRLDGVSTDTVAAHWTLFSFEPVPGAWGALAARAHRPGVARLNRFEDWGSDSP